MRKVASYFAFAAFLLFLGLVSPSPTQAQIASLGSDDVANICSKFTAADQNANCVACANTALKLSVSKATDFPTDAQCSANASLTTDEAKNQCKACVASGLFPQIVADLAPVVSEATSADNPNDGKDVTVNGAELNFVGSPNCGSPDVGLDGNTAVTKCCNSPKDVNTALKERAMNIIPRTLCPPDWIGAPLSAISSNLLNPLNIINPVGAGLNVVKNIFGKSGSGSANDTQSGAKFCFTDLVRVGVGKMVGTAAFLGVDNKNLPQKACIESAIPVVGGNRLALETEYGDPSCKCMYPEDVQGGLLADSISQSFCSKYINQTDSPDEYQGCISCKGAWTGLGCIGTDVGGFVSSLLKIGLGISFGAAFIVMLYSAYLLQTSQGNPEKIKKARDYLSSAIIGILVVIFATFILQLVGVQILRIPGIGQ